MRRLTAVVLALALLVPLAATPPAVAQVSVYDVINWLENALQVIQQAYEIYQKYEQLANDYRRYATMVKNLEVFDELSIRSLVGLASAVNEIIQAGESLGHTIENIDYLFAETFAGYQSIGGDEWLATYELKSRRTLDTMRYVLKALHRISWSSIPSQDQLGDIAQHMEDADGNLEVQQAGNELLHHQSVETAKLNQQISLLLNTQVVFWGYQVDKEAAELATAQQWIQDGVDEVPEYDDDGGLRGVPFGFPYN